MLAVTLGLMGRWLPWPGPSGQQDDCVAAVTALFRDIAVAVEENEAFLRDNFGAASVVDVVMGLQVGLAFHVTTKSAMQNTCDKVVLSSRLQPRPELAHLQPANLLSVFRMLNGSGQELRICWLVRQ